MAAWRIPSPPIEATHGATPLEALERRLLDEFQHGFPLSPRPFAEIARRLGTDERSVVDALGRLSAAGFISRIGAVYAPHRAGWSTLAAMQVPADRFDDVARLVSEYAEVNHNYEREHGFNLWFVVTAPDEAAVHAVLDDIEARCGIAVLDLPLEETFHIDLGFPLRWT